MQGCRDTGTVQERDWFSLTMSIVLSIVGVGVVGYGLSQQWDKEAYWTYVGSIIEPIMAACISYAYLQVRNM